MIKFDLICFTFLIAGIILFSIMAALYVDGFFYRLFNKKKKK